MNLPEFFHKMGGEDRVQRAYDIHGKHYGDSLDHTPITPEDQKFYDEFIVEAVELGTTCKGSLPLGVVIWLAYASKYVEKD